MLRGRQKAIGSGKNYVGATICQVSRLICERRCRFYVPPKGKVLYISQQGNHKINTPQKEDDLKGVLP